MPRELITIQVGQCGNQIGRRFWDLALKEHAQHHAGGLFDDSMSSFFRNVDARDHSRELPVRDGSTRISALKARAVLVDMEEGPVSETLRGPLGELFDSTQLITDVSGSGNNWAHGHCLYGPQHREALEDAVRRATELCDSLQSFFLLHSLGGGTGSGLGTYICGMLADCFPDVYRFSTAVFPSAANDDVVTSPYNSVLALAQLTEHADCVLPVDNAALAEMAARARNGGRSGAAALSPGMAAATGQETGGGGGGGAGGMAIPAPTSAEAFDAMNTIAAQLLTHLTSGMRFEGSLNVDLNEVTTNLVPFPRMHYLCSSLGPTLGLPEARRGMASPDQLFTDAFARETQLMSVSPREHTYLACGLLVRGAVEVSDINRNVERMQRTLRMASWNTDGFKVGLCSVPPAAQRRSLLCLANNCGIAEVFTSLRSRFRKFYKRRAHVHHYEQFMDGGGFDEAAASLDGVIGDYRSVDKAQQRQGGAQGGGARAGRGAARKPDF